MRDTLIYCNFWDFVVYVVAMLISRRWGLGENKERKLNEQLQCLVCVQTLSWAELNGAVWASVDDDERLRQASREHYLNAMKRGISATQGFSRFLHITSDCSMLFRARCYCELFRCLLEQNLIWCDAVNTSRLQEQKTALGAHQTIRDKSASFWFITNYFRHLTIWKDFFSLLLFFSPRKPDHFKSFITSLR